MIARAPAAAATALRSPRLALRLRRLGVVNPVWTIRAAKLADIELAVLVAVLFMESSGGDNVFGHDPTICAGWGEVTKAKYAAYLRLRAETGQCQGVGPCQLTSASLQTEADNAGGCYLPIHNLAVGAHYLAEILAAHKGQLLPSLTAYNGSGPAANAYGQRAVALVAHYSSLGV
jgi:hypothetical protein